MIKFSAAAISLGKLFHSSIMRILNECLKLFKVADTADTDLSLKQWLGLKGRKSSPHLNHFEGSSPFRRFIVL